MKKRNRLLFLALLTGLVVYVAIASGLDESALTNMEKDPVSIIGGVLTGGGLAVLVLFGVLKIHRWGK